MIMGSEDLHFTTVVEMGMRGWIIDGIAKEAAESIKLSNSRVYLPTRTIHRMNPKISWEYYRLINSQDILFMHFRSFFQCYSRVSASNIRVFITHVDSKSSFDSMQVNTLNKARRLIFQNQSVRDYVVSMGVNPEICLISHGAVSDKIFFPSQTPPSTNYILISGEYKPRKNPELIRNVILANQDLPFILHGDGWDSYFDGAIPRNLVLLPFNKLRQPKLMREARLLLSLSLNEGGPFPVLEALASGTPVVCTNTGFAPELVLEDSGVVLSNSPSIHQISQALKVGIALKENNWARNLLPIGHDWETFGRALYLS